MERTQIFNLIFFNAVWFACVLGAANGMGWLGPLVLVAFAVWQLSISHVRASDLQLLLVAGAVGWLIDTAYIQSGLLSYASPAPSVDVAPWWILALWFNFALTLNHVLRWLQNRFLLAAAFGAVGGPLAYYAGVRLDAVYFEATAMNALVVLAVAWALVTPLLVWLAGYSQRARLAHAIPNDESGLTR